MSEQEQVPIEITDLMDEASGDIAVGELEAAVAKYSQCTERAPNYFDGWHALGMALMKTGRFTEAIAAGLRSVELKPNDQLAWSSLSMFYVRNNQIAEAESAGVKARILSWGGKIAKEEADAPPSISATSTAASSTTTTSTIVTTANLDDTSSTP